MKLPAQLGGNSTTLSRLCKLVHIYSIDVQVDTQAGVADNKKVLKRETKTPVFSYRGIKQACADMEQYTLNFVYIGLNVSLVNVSTRLK